MSDIATINQLTQIPVQPPLSWYFDPKALEADIICLRMHQGRKSLVIPLAGEDANAPSPAGGRRLG